MSEGGKEGGREGGREGGSEGGREGGREGRKEGEREETVPPSYKCISYFPPASTSRSSLCQTLGLPRPSPFFLLPLQPLWLETQVAGHCDTI